MKDNRGHKNCWYVSGIQEKEEEWQLFRPFEFRESMGSKNLVEWEFWEYGILH
jgi:hypothetical protein